MVLKAKVNMKPYGHSEVIAIPKKITQDSQFPLKENDKKDLILEVVGTGFLVRKRVKEDKL